MKTTFDSSTSSRPTRSQPRWEEIFASMGDGVMIMDADRTLIGVNPAAERLTGISAETALGHRPEDVFLENRDVFQKLAPVFQNFQNTTLREITWWKKRAERATVDLSVASFVDEESNLAGWILVFRDMTPVKNLEEEVRKADRLAMMGTIAAGLAHEIKNPLGGIKGAAQFLARQELDVNAQECLDIIVKEVDRVDRLLGELLTFTRPKKILFESLNLHELLDQIVLLQKPLSDQKKVKISREYDPSLPPILGEKDELHQVFLNFIKNALEAVPAKKGHLKISSRFMMNFRIRESEDKKPAQMVMVEITDNGPGIPEENLEKIFTPFFTTKESGHGLGLAITQRIVNEHGGLIRVQSEKGKGTTFQIYLRSAVRGNYAKRDDGQTYPGG